MNSLVLTQGKKAGVRLPVPRLASLPISVVSDMECHCPGHNGLHAQAYYDGPVPVTAERRVAYFANGGTEQEAVANLQKVLMEAIERDYQRTFPAGARQLSTWQKVRSYLSA